MFCGITIDEVAFCNAIHRNCPPRAARSAAIIFNMPDITKCRRAYRGDAVGYGDGGEASAVRESIRAYRGDAVGYGDGGEASTAGESRNAYRGDAVGDGDGGEAAAVMESIITYRCDAVGNGDGGEAAATFKRTVMADGGKRGDGIGGSVEGYRGRDDQIACYVIVIGATCSGAYHFGMTAYDVVVERLAAGGDGGEGVGPSRGG